MNDSQTLEIVGGKSFEQVGKLIEAAVSTGTNSIHLRHCDLSSEEIKNLKSRYQNAGLIFDGENLFKVLTLLRDVKKGDMLTLQDLDIKQGHNGITADLLSQILGKKSIYDLKRGTTLTFGLIDL